MDHAICTVAAAPVRKEDAHRSEMVNQLLFGETMAVLDTRGEWLLVRSHFDGYEGWLTNHLVSCIDEATATQPAPYVTTGLINPVTLPDALVNAPMGASLTGYDEETRLLWDGEHKYHGTFRNTTTPYDMDLLWRIVQAWLHAPYLWGGKTFLGVDCSGFVQTVFKVLGVPLLRDAWQQAGQGRAVSLEGAQTGDVAFFHNEEGRVVHVGIIMNDDRIVHAAGKVRTDRITGEGIINSDHGRKTHSLHSVRRLLQF